ncbi:hypothetical protein TWF481_007931 [Arthrobotrys musiformis]|uniref:Uncharacterized protein n=1 Tax=Arthrobotrys musiformis TaxID=47236 RepID=A0AAV9W6L7_9PEZI
MKMKQKIKGPRPLPLDEGGFGRSGGGGVDTWDATKIDAGAGQAGVHEREGFRWNSSGRQRQAEQRWGMSRLAEDLTPGRD